MEGVVGEFLEIPTIPPKNERATKQSAPKNSPNTSGEKKAKSKEDTNKTKQFVEDKRIIMNITSTLMLAPRKRSNSPTKESRRESISLEQKRWVSPQNDP